MGFVNYFPSNERTQSAVDYALKKYGDNIAIIDGEDDWNAPDIFNIAYLLNMFKIDILDSFHTGVSGITKSGAIINKNDLNKFIEKFNKIKWKKLNKGYSSNYKIKIYDVQNKTWKIFFELKYDCIDKYNSKYEIQCVVNNFKILKNRKIRIMEFKN